MIQSRRVYAPWGGTISPDPYLMPANLLAGYKDNDLAIIRLAFSTLYVLGLPASMYFYFFDFLISITFFCSLFYLPTLYLLFHPQVARPAGRPYLHKIAPIQLALGPIVFWTLAGSPRRRLGKGGKFPEFCRGRIP